MISRIYSRPAGLLVIFAAIAIALGASIDDLSLRIIVERLAAIIVALAPALVVVMAAVGAGMFFLPARGLQLRAAEALLLAFGCGAAVLTLPVALSIFNPGILQQPVVWAVCGLFIIAGLARFLRAPAALGLRLKIPDLRIARPVDAILVIILLFAAGIIAVAALTPPILYDVTEYHLGAVSDYLRAGGMLGKLSRQEALSIVPMPHNWFARFPFPVESLYYLGILLGHPHDFAAKVLNAAFIAGCALLIDAWLRRAGSAPRWRMLAVVAFLSHKVTLEVSLDAYIDAATAFFFCASVYAALLVLGKFDRHEREPRMAVAAALLFGMALVAKYTVAQLYLLGWTLMLLLPILVLLIRRHAFVLLGIAIIAGAIPIAAWLGKNWYFYGNPLEPFFARLFPPQQLGGALREQFYIESHGPQNPTQAVYWSTLSTRLGAFGWYLLAPLVAIPLVWRRNGNARLFAIVALAYPLWNLIRQSESRFLLPAILLLCVLAAQIVPAILGRIPRRALAALIMLFCAGNLTLHFLRMSNGEMWQYVAQFPIIGAGENNESNPIRANYLKKNLGEVGEAAVKANTELPPDAKLLLVYEARPYLFERETVYNTVFDVSELLRIARGANSADEITAKLRAAGITHVLVNRRELRRFIEQYARASQLEELGITDILGEFGAMAAPEDLYPPFYLDPDWQAMRAPVIEFLRRMREAPLFTTGRSPAEVYVVRL